MGPKKKWGQNFLRNRGAVEKIVAAVQPRDDEILLEIGPGEGALTERLLELGRPVIALEIDPELTARLKERYGERLDLRHADALEAELPATPYRAVGNLPYNAGTPILRRVIADPRCRRAVFMLQKEVADRIVAKPGTDAFGFLTLFVQLYAEPRHLMTLEPRSFYPPPKVRSAVVVLDPRPPAVRGNRAELAELISNAFRMRRKTLVNNLTGWRGLSREEALDAVVQAGLSETIRSEQMSLAEFDRLDTALKNEGGIESPHG
ncbi:MAG TPA: 16S rRNA (adenine(1518)-N(6)/adenine(1519)-N(6))-dimethyltransferase RsmA [Thermoanaerobaculia bacterium]|nr:16S rRNA (adenine(1518)-N(6)/adenine(1519)-N(6))-dimethyltransferase RsmA [Thermoanaerobaculia bacterium]